MTKRRNVADWLECPDQLWTRGVKGMAEGNILLCVAVIEGALQVGNTDWNHSLVTLGTINWVVLHWNDTLPVSFLLVNSQLLIWKSVVKYC